MKLTMPLEKFALLATFLVTVSIRAEGTLPIPITKAELPLTLNGEAFSNPNAPRRDLMEVSVDEARSSASVMSYKVRCRSGENFFPAGGRVVLGIDSFDIKGICSNGAAGSGQKQIIAANEAELVQLDGELKGAPATTFKGQLKRVNLVGANPESTGLPATLRFDLSRSGF